MPSQRRPSITKSSTKMKSIRVLEVTLEPDDEEPIHHHRWPSVFVFDQVAPPIIDFAR